MNHKQILGRASLSFPAIEGILDMDQILETDPWEQINDFVQCNFVQNILNEFNDRVTLDPKHTPTDNKSPAKKRRASSSRNARKSQTGQRNEEKLAEGKGGDLEADAGPKSGERKTEIAKKNKSSRNERSKNDEKKERVSSCQKNGEKSKIVEKEDVQRGKENSKKKPDACRKSLNNREVAEDGPKIENKRRSVAKPVKRGNKNCSTVSLCDPLRAVKTEMKDATEDESSAVTTTSKSRYSKSPLKASTPVPKVSEISNSLGKEYAVAKPVKRGNKNGSTVSPCDPLSAVKTEMKDATEDESSAVTTTSNSRYSKSPLKASTPMPKVSEISNSLGKEYAVAKREGVATKNKYSSARKPCSSRKCATKDLNNNCPSSKREEQGCQNVAGSCTREAAVIKTIKKEKKIDSKDAVAAVAKCKQTEELKCNKRDEKTATTEKKKVGKFEQRLLDERKRREARKIRRLERKAERAMEKFGRHVSQIAKRMGYPTDTCISSISDDCDSYSDSSDESSYSDSCCSNSSCSCCTSCSYSSEYSEYTPGSSSD